MTRTLWRRIPALLVLLILTLVAKPAGVHGNAHPEAPPAGLTPDAWQAIRAAVERDRYAAQTNPDGELEAVNPAQEYRTRFTAEGITVQPRGAGFKLGLRLERWGYGESLEAVPTAEPGVVGQRVTYVRGGLEEWYVNRPTGLEQGFTVAAAPRRTAGKDAAGSLRLEMSVSGATGEAAADTILFKDGEGLTRLSYGGLVAWDATGRELPTGMRLVEQRLILEVDDHAAVYPLTIDPVIEGKESAKFTASDGEAGDNFGRSVAVSGGTVVVSAFLDDDEGDGSGSAYVFVKPSGGWTGAGSLTESRKLTASDGAAGDQFGHSVAVSGDTVVVGARRDDDDLTNAGSAYVFVEPGGGWTGAGSLTESRKLTASDGAAGDQFGGQLGTSVAVSGNTVVAGAVGDNDNGTSSGSAYVFVEPGGGWTGAGGLTEDAKLTASDGAQDDRFGFSVAVSDDTVVVGAFLDDHNGVNDGSAYVFVEPVGGWTGAGSLTEDMKLAAGEVDDRLGISVAVSGDTMAVGATGDDDNDDTSSGAAYVFQEVAVTMSLAGSGSGTVTSNPAGINCGSDCSETFAFGTFVTLTPSPAVGSIFGGWGGACIGVETLTCQGEVTEATSVTATFTITTRTLTVSGAGSGSGTVTSSPAGIDCGSECSEAYTFGTTVTLTASPAAGSTFGGWGGACSGTGTCEVTMTEARSVTATFTITTPTLTVSGAGSGSGTVTSSPAGIDCGSDCSEAYTYGTTVTLTAAPAAGSIFGGWGGACSGTGTCEVTMTEARSVTATFSLTGTLQFSSAAYSVTEPSGSEELVTITRTGGSAGAIAVTFATSDGTATATFATSDGTATAGSDYTATTETVSWADGETASKTVNVEILDDKVVEADETVHLTLSNPTGGATLGTPSEADLTILDDDDGAVIGLGPGGGGRMDEVSLSAPHTLRDRFDVPWNAYNTANGETRPVFCNLDGEGHHELVVGLGPGGGGWVEVRERLDDGNFAHKGWTGVPFTAYNTANGETRPACGDLDGDGLDEIVIGLGSGARGILEIRDDALANFAHIAWIQVPWAAYNDANGENLPRGGRSGRRRPGRDRHRPGRVSSQRGMV